jgi:hypothetical protein
MKESVVAMIMFLLPTSLLVACFGMLLLPAALLLMHFGMVMTDEDWKPMTALLLFLVVYL